MLENKYGHNIKTNENKIPLLGHKQARNKNNIKSHLCDLIMCGNEIMQVPSDSKWNECLREWFWTVIMLRMIPGLTANDLR